MFKGNRPIFKPNHILKSQMLTLGIDYSEDMLKNLYLSYSDGILAGTKLTVTEKKILVHPGVLKYKGNFYTMNNVEEIPYQADGKQYYLRILFQKEIETYDEIVRTSDFIVTQEAEKKPEELELARFKLKEGAMLRQNYQDFSDLNTEHNTLNLIYSDYAGLEQSSLHPEITYLYGRELLQLAKEPIDIYFAMECIKGTALPKIVILEFIKKHFPEEKIKDNYDIFQKLQKILKDLKGEPEDFIKHKRAKRLIVE